MPGHSEEDERHDEDERQRDDEERERFEADLEVRGEVVAADEGDLPPGATHVIEEGDDGERRVRRRRFSAQ